MNNLQQMSLVAYMVIHPFDCSCTQCADLGGILNLIDLYKVSDFTDVKLRKIYAWLLKNLMNQGCQIKDLNFHESTAPKLSDIVHCSNESMIFENMDDRKTRRYLLLKDILCS